MNPLFHENDGSRPSRLDLARQLTAELPREDSEFLAAFEAEIAESAKALEPFDWEILTSAAERTVEEPRVEQEAPREGAPWWKAWWLVPALMACLLLILVVPGVIDQYAGVKGDQVDIDFMVLVDGEPRPGLDGATLAEGDRLQFSYYAPGLSDVVLLSIDGEGTLSIYYPASGDLPHAVTPGERHFLEGSIRLDGAAGPEVFVAVFGAGSVAEAVELVEEAYAAGSHEAVQALEDQPGVATIRIEKSP